VVYLIGLFFYLDAPSRIPLAPRAPKSHSKKKNLNLGRGGVPLDRSQFISHINQITAFSLLDPLANLVI
jgi:hypothetical protein